MNIQTQINRAAKKYIRKMQKMNKSAQFIREGLQIHFPSYIITE